MIFKKWKKVFKFKNSIFVFSATLFLGVVMIGVVWAQSPTPNPTIQKTETRLNDKEWATQVFQNLLFPLNIEEMSILQKQLRLSDAQMLQIKNLNSSYKLQQQLLKEVSALDSGNYSAPEKNVRETNEKAKKNNEECLRLAKQLRDLLGLQDGDFLYWLNEEDAMRFQLPKVKRGLTNATPEDIAATFVKVVNQHQKPGIKRSADKDWWLEKRALLAACDLDMPMGKRGNPKELELKEKRTADLHEMMSR